MFPYTLLPDGQTLEPEDVVKPPAETQAEPTLTQSPHLDFGNPPPSPTPTTPKPEPVTGPPAFDTGPSPYFTQEATSYAQPPSSEEEAKRRTQRIEKLRERWEKARQSATPPTIEETASDISDTETGDYPGEEPELPQVTAGEAYIDLYHMADHLRLMGRAYRDSSPDALGVMGDGLLRPYTYSTIFQHFPSCRRSLEFIYADPLDINDCPVIDFARRLWSGHGGASGGSSGDAGNNVEETFTLDDVRQFTEISLGTETFDGDDVAHYKKMLVDVFEYDIVFDDENYNYSPTEKIRQLQNLAKANVHIVNYLEIVFVDDEHRSGLSVFKQYFSKSEYGQLEIHLGANSVTGGAGYGLVPLDERYSEELLKSMYLGSRVDIPTIVHEFGHVIDRSVNMTAHLKGDAGDGEFRLMHADETFGPNLNRDILDYVIEGFVAKQFFAEELWADLFMTAVLDPNVSGAKFKVESIGDIKEHVDIFTTFTDPDGPLFECGNDAPCIEQRIVEWENTNNARVVRAFLPEVFRHILQSEKEG